jgi:peptidoglycan/xylan/chitin deacetylase (PgdA/CDA1 family)
MRQLSTVVNTRPKKTQLLRWLPRRIVLTHGPATRKTLYLTFDDGPDPATTPRLIDMLAEHAAHATFFLIGERVERHPEIVRRLVAAGHALGNHSYDHPKFDAITATAQDEQIARTDRLLAQFDGRVTRPFRPPYGVLPAALIARSMLRRRQLAYWSVDSLDYQQRPTRELVDILRHQPPHAGDVILMHDDRPLTLELLAVMLPEWRRTGFSFEALPDAA